MLLPGITRQQNLEAQGGEAQASRLQSYKSRSCTRWLRYLASEAFLTAQQQNPAMGPGGPGGSHMGGADRTPMLYVFCELQRVDDLGQFVDMTYL